MADKQYIDQRGQVSLFDGAEEYESFIRKFESKKTTDDCYTPPEIYEVVRDWACKEYGVDPGKIVRPFYPGGDYEAEQYPDGCCVLDNPPFSILSRICAFYLARNIRFFLFAPSLTVFGARANVMRLCHIVCDANITYANGAVVRTAFVTNLEPGCIARTAPDLGKAIAEAADKLRRETVRELPKYTYPPHILTAAMLQRYSKYGIDLRIGAEDCRPISALDAQRAAGKAIFGGGAPLIGSDRRREGCRREGCRNRVAAEPTGAADGCGVGRWMHWAVMTPAHLKDQRARPPAWPPMLSRPLTAARIVKGLCIAAYGPTAPNAGQDWSGASRDREHSYEEGLVRC